MSQLEEVGERDGWRCWVCDEKVDPATSVNDARGPSVDSRMAKPPKGGKPDFAGGERLAHRGCNTKKGAVAAVIPWPTGLFIIEPAPLVAVAERLDRKGGREVVARCPDRDDAQQAADWLVLESDDGTETGPKLGINDPNPEGTGSDEPLTNL